MIDGIEIHESAELPDECPCVGRWEPGRLIVVRHPDATPGQVAAMIRGALEPLAELRE